ncbi:MAG: right-handed parallel beta-helix repeat-containing protein [Candidatus Thorarchaeota archaeon]
MKHAKFVMILLTMLFIVGSTTVTGENTTVLGEELGNNPFNGKMLSAYTTHAVIQIVNDTDFMWQAGNESWLGDGSSDTPYIISGYNITNDAQVSIEIRDVTVYFEIRDCYIRSTTHENVGGVVLYNVTHGHLEDCLIINKNTGLELDYCDNLSVVNCTMDNNAAATTVDFSNHTTYVDSYFINTTTGSGIYQSDSYWTTVNGCYIIDNNDYGVESYISEYFTFLDSEVSGNGYAGFLIENTHHGLYQSNSVFDNGEEGFIIAQSNYVTTIENEVYENNRGGFYTTDVQFGVFSDNTIYNNRLDGLDIDTGSHCIIESNDVFDNGWIGFAVGATADGLIIDGTDNCSVIGNTVYNSSKHGIELRASTNAVIEDNTVYGNFGVEGECGIYVNSATFSNITNNVVYNNTENGIYMYQSDDCRVIDNVVYHNAINGIFLSWCNRTFLQYNDFGWNPTNALDDTSSNRINYWDDGEIGNWYSNYNGTGTYNITGSADSVDMYPSISLIGGPASDTQYELGSTGNTMVMTAHALNPWYYEAYTDTTLIDTDDWDGGDVNADIDGLDVGVYNISIHVYHISGHEVSDTAQVTVVDTTAPDWVTQPEDQIVYYGEALSYQVSATDLSGVGGWSVNDTRFVIVEGLITNNTVLSIGNFGLRIGVNDTYGNERSFEIRIRVMPEPTVPTTSSTTVTTTATTTTISTTTTPTTPGPSDPTMILIVLGAGGIAAVVIVVLVLKRRTG